MPVPSIISDNGSGNLGWNVIQPYSQEPDFPFSDKGDNTSFDMYQRYKIDKTAYRPRASMSTAAFTFGTAYLTKLGRPRDIGNGIYDVEDKFSSLPANRTEYGSFPFTQQWYDTIVNTNADPTKYFYDVTWDTTEQTFTVKAEIDYEYFLFTPPAPLIKSRVFFIFSRLFYLQGLPQVGTREIAEDSNVSIYAGKIFCRRTPYVLLQPPSLQG